MRGKPGHFAQQLNADRLIPAHAGKTNFSPPLNSMRSAHPRACGENHVHLESFDCARGSSPRMRGKRRRQIHYRTPRRLIPAHAGKTEPSYRRAGYVQAHPRACGENTVSPLNIPALAGSSPRMRGKRQLSPRHAPHDRLIPAHAGKTGRLQDSVPESWAHPRACGENGACSSSSKSVMGSSPRMRGKHGRARLPVSEVGLIPAHAGKTYSEAFTQGTARAHPRACGENAAAEAPEQTTPGSSPRMRGKRKSLALPACSAGLIPAHAGKTLHIWIRAGLRPAHPRACGENGLA